MFPLTAEAIKSQIVGPTLNAGLAEPLFTVILEDHLGSASALDLICAMAPKTTMKVRLFNRRILF